MRKHIHFLTFFRPLALISLLALPVGAWAEEAETPYVLPPLGPFHSEQIEVANSGAIAYWFRSAHADAASEAFSRWDEDEGIRPTCAICHAGEGFRAYHGLDGSEPGVPTENIPAGGVVDCDTCHNPGLKDITEIAFPSGVMHPVVGVEAACMTCHQGRSAGVTVENAVGDKPADTPDASLRFVNPHYATAAATWLGGIGGAGVQYPGLSYSGRFFHSKPVSTCNSCHEPHTLEVQADSCQTCHQADSPQAIRIARQSYDGSGDTSKGIREDIATNAALLLEMVGRYADEIAGAPLVYDGDRYPYFFADANRDGRADELDGRPVNYGSWTPRSLRAAYNWKLVTADRGAYAHNPHYALELLHDSIADLAGPLGVDMDALNILR